MIDFYETGVLAYMNGLIVSFYPVLTLVANISNEPLPSIIILR